MKKSLLSLAPSSPPLIPSGGSYFIQSSATDQFGNPMSSGSASWTVSPDTATITASSTPPGALFQAPAVTAPTTIPVTVTDGTLTKTISITVQPDLTGGHWGTYNDPPPYQPVVSYSGTVSVDDPSNPGPASYTEDFLGGSYGGRGASGQSASAALSDCGVAFQYTWVPDAPGGTPPSVAYLSVSAYADANGLFSASGNSSGSADATDGLGDTESTSTSTNGGTAAQSASSSGTHVFQVDSHTGTASFAVPSLSASASGDVSAEVDAGASASVVDAPSVSISGPSLYSGAILPVEDVSVTVHASGTFGAVPITYLQSLTLTVQGGGGGGTMTPDDGNAVFDLGTLTAGTYTLTATAVYDTDGLSVSVSSPPLTFYVATFTAQGGSWSPDPAYVGDTVTGQVQGKLDPQSLDGGSYFVDYSWNTGQVYYSQDGTSGTFEPYGGNDVLGWSQGKATTEFTAVFFDAGFYILEVIGTATVYSVYTGQAAATFTATAYVGGDASAIDQSGGNTPHALRAHPNAQGGATGLPVDPPKVEIDVNDTQAPNDDYVQNGHSMNCQVKLDKAAAMPITVNLAVTSIGTGCVILSSSSVNFSAGQQIATFAIRGTANSSSLNDVTISATDGVSPTSVTTTVWDFANPICTAVPKNDYYYDGNAGTLSVHVPGVILTASISVVPKGVPETAPGLAKQQ